MNRCLDFGICCLTGTRTRPPEKDLIIVHRATADAHGPAAACAILQQFGLNYMLDRCPVPSRSWVRRDEKGLKFVVAIRVGSMRINRSWWCRAALYVLAAPTFAFVALISTASAQKQGAKIMDLLGTEWLLEDLGGSGVIDNARATLSFPEPGKAEGKGSCNSFFAPVEIKGDHISFGLIGATRMQCAEAVSDQEERYLAALAEAERVSSDGPHLLVHTKLLEKPLRFSRLEKKL